MMFLQVHSERIRKDHGNMACVCFYAYQPITVDIDEAGGFFQAMQVIMNHAKVKEWIRENE